MDQIATNTPIVPPVPFADVTVTYDPWFELEALVLTAEYCVTYGITDPLEVRLVHYHALCVVLEDSQ
jgi:hypothetical protein